jgi:hypothetical protein
MAGTRSPIKKRLGKLLLNTSIQTRKSKYEKTALKTVQNCCGHNASLHQDVLGPAEKGSKRPPDPADQQDHGQNQS